MVYYKFYHYEPSLAAACSMAVLFGILTACHTVLVFRKRTWFFIPVIVGGVFEVTGYIARAISASEAPSNLSIGPYVVQTLMLLVAPPLFAATLYMLLGRIVVALNSEKYSLISPRWSTRIFVTSDVICFIVQLGGAGLMASSHPSTASTGSHIVLAGLLLQIVIFGFFGLVTITFHRRLLQKPTSRSISAQPHWRRLIWLLYITSACILMRNIVRVAEFVEGFEGYIILHEAFLYALDATPMLLVMIPLAVGYPWIWSVLSMGQDEGEKQESVTDLAKA